MAGGGGHAGRAALLVGVIAALACGGLGSGPAVDPNADPLADPPVPPGVWLPPDAPMCNSAYLLTHYRYEDLQKGKYCDLCSGADPMACVLDWPFSDVPPCQALDGLRNSIYAYYGRPFASDLWKVRFGAESWYKPDPDYTDDRLDDLARHNVEVLKKLSDTGTGCTR